MATSTKNRTSKNQPKTQRSPRPRGANPKAQPSDEKTSRRHHTQVKQWLHASRPRQPAPLTWIDDSKLDRYEGRDGEDIWVVLTPHVDVGPQPKRLIKEANLKTRRAGAEYLKKFPKDAKQRNFKVQRTTLLTIQPPPKDSGLHIFDARLHGLDHLCKGGAMLYQFTAKDVAEAKKHLAEVVVKLRLQAIDSLVHDLSLQLDRPPEVVLHRALRELSQHTSFSDYAKDYLTRPNQPAVK